MAARGQGKQKAQRAKLAELLASRCDALILTSATPHDGKPESFASLMNLLDPTAVANPSSYGPDEIQGLYVRRFKRDIAAEARLEDAAADVERQIKARDEWIKAGMATSELPYLRLAVVLSGTTPRGSRGMSKASDASRAANPRRGRCGRARLRGPLALINGPSIINKY